MRVAQALGRVHQAPRRARPPSAWRIRAAGAVSREHAQRASPRRARASRRATGSTSSAAAVGVGARWSAAKSAMVKSVSWPTPTTTGMRAGADRARQRLLVELPQVLDRAAAAHQQQHVALGARVARRASIAAMRSAARRRPAPAPDRRSPGSPDCAARSVVRTSRSAAAAERGEHADRRADAPAAARLAAASNRPSLLELLLERAGSARRAARRPPRRIASTVSWKRPRGS